MKKEMKEKQERESVGEQAGEEAPEGGWSKVEKKVNQKEEKTHLAKDLNST